MFTLFFVAPEEIDNAEISLTGTQAHHAISVLRVQRNESIRLADGLGTWVEGVITELGREKLTVQVRTRGADRIPATSIAVAQAVLKGDNQKAALDQLVQAGAEEIIPWQAQRSVGALDKSAKWREVILAAARQSRRARIPQLAAMTDISGVIARASQFDAVVALHESAYLSLTGIASLFGASNLLVIVGPEGGLSEDELNEFTQAGIPSAKLGDPVIRADLAGAIALGALQVITKEW
jgi:16S rRNA (uracil1498-N3)-methyltransferase